MKRYSRRFFHGLRGADPDFADIDGMVPLSSLLSSGVRDDLFLCGPLAAMSLDYINEPLSHGWTFSRHYIHKFRSPFYEKGGRRVAVKLVGESWLPGCTSTSQAAAAWVELSVKYKRATSLPLLGTPAKTGQALLWKHLPDGLGEVELPPEASDLVRHISPQHRLQSFSRDADLYAKYDGRWMYAALCYLDRLPVGEPRGTNQYVPYRPGWYRCSITIPLDWSHVGLIPMKVTANGSYSWSYPSDPGFRFEEWVSEPEIAVALKAGWRIRVLDGFQFASGRPLCEWQKVLVELRDSMADPLAGAAIRQVLNHTIGSMHRNDVEREVLMDDAEWKVFPKAQVFSWESVFSVDRGNVKRVMVREPHRDKLSIYMPHWSAQIYALERARIASHLLTLPYARIAEVRGDAIYLSLPDDGSSIADKGRLGQLRFQGIDVLKEVR